MQSTISSAGGKKANKTEFLVFRSLNRSGGSKKTNKQTTKTYGMSVIKAVEKKRIKRGRGVLGRSGQVLTF